MSALTVLIIAGSDRTGSHNVRLSKFAGARARTAGHRVDGLSLRDLALPVYDADLEAAAGVPGGAYRLQRAIIDCDAMLLVTPEYNGFPTPLVINAFDWLSRIVALGDRPAGLAVTAYKPVALLSASPGAGGALRSMNFLRQYLQMAFAMVVVPTQFALARAHEAFDSAGELKDQRAATSVDQVLVALTRVAKALKATPT